MLMNTDAQDQVQRGFSKNPGNRDALTNACPWIRSACCASCVRSHDFSHISPHYELLGIKRTDAHAPGGTGRTLHPSHCYGLLRYQRESAYVIVRRNEAPRRT